MFQSIGTFIVVTLVFGEIFKFMNIPFYVAILMGAIALATAPAPALSIVQEYKAKGPVSGTLIPMAVLDDVVAIVIFFTVISILTATKTDQSTSLLMTLFGRVELPLIVGGIVGWITSFGLKQDKDKISNLVVVFMGVLVSAGLGLFINQQLLSEPLMNFILIGMVFSAVFANLVSEARLVKIMESIEGMIALFLLLSL